MAILVTEQRRLQNKHTHHKKVPNRSFIIIFYYYIYYLLLRVDYLFLFKQASLFSRQL